MPCKKTYDSGDGTTVTRNCARGPPPVVHVVPKPCRRQGFEPLVYQTEQLFVWEGFGINHVRIEDRAPMVHASRPEEVDARDKKVYEAASSLEKKPGKVAYASGFRLVL